MGSNKLNRFYFGIVIPSILTIGLFILSIYFIFIPSFEKNMIERKKEMIGELTNTAWSLINEYYLEYSDSLITLTKAKNDAAKRIEKMRYGAGSKDYFWITDMQPKMIMHPYKPDLNGTDLSEYTDREGNKLFVEAVNIVKKEEQGYFNYIWQWKDDSTRFVPKLSYVKGHKGFDWIIGTGIYLEDLKLEILFYKRRLFRISLIITFVIAVILIYIARQSFKTERKRSEVEEKLRWSRIKYQSLVEASTEGTLMLIEEKIIFSNNKFNKMIGISSVDVLNLSFNEIFEFEWKELINSFKTPGKSVNIETKLKCHDDSLVNVIISASKMSYSGSDGYIIVVKDINHQIENEKITEKLTSELQTSLLLMNQPIGSFVRNIITCQLDTSILEAAKLMSRKKRHVIFIKKDENVIGILNDSDFNSRVISKGLDLSTPVSEIMTSPVVSISKNALIYEAELLFKSKKITHLAVKNSDGNIVGVISNEDMLEMQRNTLSYLLKEIDLTEEIEELVEIYKKVPLLVKALLESGDKTENITRIITSISDSITKKVYKLNIEEIGEPPCKFAFIALGSEGRMEQTMATDQDNAIILEDLDKEELKKVMPYFNSLAERINIQLSQIGYDLCKGEIMASNPKWLQPLENWKIYFKHWISEGDAQSVLDTTVFFDFRCIVGDSTLSIKLREYINEIIEKQAVFLYHLAQNVIKYKQPINIFGNIISETSQDKNVFDIKKVLLPVLNFTKIYSLKNKLNETNTLSRLDRLYSLKVLEKSMYEELQLSYNYLMGLRFRTQINSISMNKTPDNLFEFNKLTEIEKTTLKKILSQLSNLQSKLSQEFKS